MASLSANFFSTKLRWNVLQKEAHAVVCTPTRLYCLAAMPVEFDPFTDHNNLVLILYRFLLVSDLSKVSMRMMLRWAVRLNIYN